MTDRSSRRHAMTFVVITVLIDVIGFGIIMPVLPSLLEIINPVGASENSMISGYLLFSYAVLQFFAAPVLGNLSDRFGRRNVLLASLFAYAVNYLIMGFATTLWVLFIGRVLTGVASATYATANAVIADVTPPEERAQNFGLLGMAFGVGFIIGPILGGLLGAWDVRAPFFLAAGLAFANTLYGFVVMKETLPATSRRAFSWARANPLGAILQLRAYPMLIGLIVALFLYNMAHHVYPANWNFYAMAKFDWSPLQVGVAMAYVGLFMAVVQGGLIRVVVPRLGPPRTAVVGFLGAAAAYLGIGFAQTELTLYVWLAVSALAGFVMPAVQAILTSQVPQNQQGELQGILASVASIGAIFGPITMTHVFGWFTSPQAPIHFPGAAFALAGLLTIVALFVFGAGVRGLLRSEVIHDQP